MAAGGLIRVAVVAPSPAMRAGLSALLGSDDIAVIEEGATLGAIAPFLAEIDVIVATGDALAAMEPGPALTQNESRTGWVLVGDSEENAERLRAHPWRGWALLDPDVSAGELLAAVRAVAAGLIVLAPERLAALESEMPQPFLVGDTLPVEALTERENEVLQLLAEGLANKEIARRLEISEHTVKFHVSSIYGKLGAANRAEAVTIAVRSGLIIL